MGSYYELTNMASPKNRNGGASAGPAEWSGSESNESVKSDTDSARLAGMSCAILLM